MTDRPALHNAVGAALAAQPASDPAGTFRPVFDQRAEQLDQALALADTNPGWLAAQPAYTRTALADWRQWRATHPKEPAE